MWPSVAVIVPVRNEERYLRVGVEAILAQQYPGSIEVCLAVAPSTDATSTIAAELAATHPSISVVANPGGLTPSGLNAAIKATSGEIVVRVDGHAALSPGYIGRAVETLQRTGAVNVGGVQRAVGDTPFEDAVAAAMSSPFGAGDARFHTGGAEAAVDTVYLGVFRRDALEAVGLYDERLVRNQDYELNIRLRGAGGVVWFDPELWVTYRPRGSLRLLARQFFEYGQWKQSVVRMHPRSTKLRQVIAPIATAGIILGSIGGLRWRPGFAIPGVYALAVGLASVRTARGVNARAFRLLAIFPTMHLSWGAGFLLGLLPTPRTHRQPASRSRTSALMESVSSRTRRGSRR